MISLEDQLAAGMREHTGGLVPSDDLLDRAARGNRRRRLRFASATGGLGAAAVLAVVFASTGTPTAPDVSPGRPVLTAAEVSQKALAALATGDIEHVKISFRQADLTSKQEAWYDSVTGDSVDLTVTPQPGEPKSQTWTIRHGDTATVTHVDHTARTWWTHDRPDQPGKSASQAPYSADELREQLRDGVYQVVGDEEIEGRAVVHLRRSSGGAGSDIWVDADSYRTVRRQITRPTAIGDAVMVLDFDWQPRTPEALRVFEFTPPAGYRQVPPS